MCDAVVWYCKTQYRKRHLLEMLYRKDDLFGRVLLFSAMRKMILQLRYHAVYPVVKMISIGFTVYALNLFFLAVILRFMLNRQLWNT